MNKVFTNWKLIFLFCLILLVCGWVAGKWMQTKSQEVMLVTYGFVAFAVLPITLCTFGLKELNGVFGQVATDLNREQRFRLNKMISARTSSFIFLGFFIVAVQLILAFCINLKDVDLWPIVGALFGGVLTVLVYGIFICFSVKEAADFVNGIKDKKAHQQRRQELVDRLKTFD